MTTKKKNDTPSAFKESASEIWLAGLGAFNYVGEEGSRLFQELVEKGREFEEEHEGGRLSRLTERASELKEDARSVLSKVTTPIEDGLAATMQRLGLPSHAEILKLTRRVEELTRNLQQTKGAGKGKGKADTETRVGGAD
jgi:poly(hydroxyalkanoate) granule-associated protein